MTGLNMISKAACATTVGLLATMSAAFGQTMDYSAAQDLFGEPVTTSVTGTPQRLSSAPVNMDVITADDIRRSGAATLPAILSRLSGIDVYSWSNNSADVAIRGLNQGGSNRLLVMVNGRETYTDALGVVLWENIPVRLDEIRQIEVIKGPNSALYGFNAASGVINIVTYNPQFDEINAERLTIGSDGSQAASAVRTAQWRAGGIRLSGGWNKDPESEFHPRYAGDRLAGSDPSINRTVNLDGQTALDDRSTLRIQTSATDGSMRANYLMPFYIDLSLAAGKIEYSRDIGFGQIEASLMHNHFDVGQYRNSLATGSLSNDVTIAKLQHLFKSSADDTLRFGTEYRRDEMPSFPAKGGHLLSQDAALSGMWNHDFSNDVSLLTALRGDRYWLQRDGPVIDGSPWTNEDYNRSIYAWSYNSALVWRPTALDSVKISAARGLTLPSLLELGVANPMTVPFAPPSVPTAKLLSLGNPQLQPTKITHYELSYERSVPQWNTSGKIAAYHQLVSGLRDISATQLIEPLPTPTLLSTYVNTGGAHLNGVEIDLKGRLGEGWRWNANYSFEAVADQGTPDQYHDFSRSTPRHKANAGIGWDIGSWESDLSLRIVSATEMAQQIAFGVYELVPIKTTVSLNPRLAYVINPALRLEATGHSAFADNPVSSEKRRILFSVIANY
ncbi:TonB-dependent receptor plug domain-containing protein [Telmatospirillum siberiense]|nr:TonB-dependent receptor [Telmatospirillum siberiense]